MSLYRSHRACLKHRIAALQQIVNTALFRPTLRRTSHPVLSEIEFEHFNFFEDCCGKRPKIENRRRVGRKSTVVPQSLLQDAAEIIVISAIISYGVLPYRFLRCVHKLISKSLEETHVRGGTESAKAMPQMSNQVFHRCTSLLPQLAC
jgi:hypothetical protein